MRRPEERVLLACASVTAGPVSEGRDGSIRALVLRDAIDWEYLREAALRHGVLPLVYRKLREYPDMVPGPVMAGLQEEFTRNARRNLFLTGELLRLLELLRSRGVPAVPYKGPTLAVLAYGDLALRCFADNDIMIRREDLVRARDLLLAEGYRPEFSLTPPQEAGYVRSRHSLVFEDDRGSVVELHWAVQPRYFSFDADLEALWGRLRPVRLAGRTVLTFAPEDLALILCLHGAKHMWSRLEWVADLGALVGMGGGIDWERILEESRRLGARRMLLLGLRLARDLVSAEVPASLDPLVEDDAAVAALARQVRGRLFSGGDQPDIVESSAFFVRARERLRDRVRYCARLATTPYVRDWAMVSLPRAASPLYYLIRPCRVLGKYATAAFRRF